MQQWRKEIAKRRSPFKQTDWEKEYQRLRKEGKSHSAANKYITEQGGTNISIDRGISLWNSKTNQPGSLDTPRKQPTKPKEEEYTYGERVNANRLGISPAQYRARKQAKQKYYTETLPEENRKREEARKAEEAERKRRQEAYRQKQQKQAEEAAWRASPEGQAAIDRGAEAGGRSFVKDWYSHPATRSRLKENQGLSDRQINYHMGKADSAGVGGYVPQGANAVYDPNTHQIQYNRDVHGREAIAHELVHASGFDKRVSKQIKGILGTGYGNNADYYNNPREQYGNLTDLRRKLNLDPGDRNISPQRLQQMIQNWEGTYGEGLERDFIENFGVEKISEALNKVAAVDQRGDDGSAFARKHTKPMPKWRQDIENRRRWS